MTIMRYEKGHKDATRRKILDVAGRQFRRDGSAAGVATVMAEAGLTHGGFYAHFKSKDALFAAALAEVQQTGCDAIAKLAAEGGIAAVIRAYLRPQHRDRPERGCAAAALAPEVARAGRLARSVFTAESRRYFEVLAAALPPAVPPVRRLSTAIGVFGAMMGTLQLARAVSDPELSDQILEAGAAAALRLAQVEAKA